MKKILYFDLETQKSAAEVGGWNNIKDMRLSVGIAYISDVEKEYVYSEENIGELLEQIKTADLVVGHNILRFDYEVLRYYDASFDFKSLPSFDMLVELRKKLGFRVSLDSLAVATLGGEKKLGDGLEAIKWWNDGNIEKLTKYCSQDVALTRAIFSRGVRKGHLKYLGKDGSVKAVNTSDWRPEIRRRMKLDEV